MSLRSPLSLPGRPASLSPLSRAAAALVLLLAAGPALAEAAFAPTFTDVALEAGWQDRLGHGRALVATDFDGDGWVDFFVGNPSAPELSNDESLILWNRGPDADGIVHFERGQVLLRGQIAFTASAADYDGDGDPDLFVGIGGQEGIGLDFLFENDGGLMVDVSEAAGIRGPRAGDGRPVPVATSSGTWADYDNDGDLDLFVAARRHFASYILPGGLGWRDSLFRNDGDGTFTDVSEAAGVGSGKSSMTATWGDFDDDGWVDLYVPYLAPFGFQFFRNRGDGTFAPAPISPESLGFDGPSVWASSATDFDRDGRLDVISYGRRDLVAGKVGPTHALLMNRGGWSFFNATAGSGLVPEGVPAPSVMGTAVGDLDNDGYPELFFGNGAPYFGEADTLFANVTETGGPPRFEAVSALIDSPAPFDPGCSPPAGPAETPQPVWLVDAEMTQTRPDDPRAADSGEAAPHRGDEIDPCDPPYPYRGHGTLFVDFDHDGDLDIVAVKGGTEIIRPEIWSGEPNRLFENEGGNAGHWLFVELEGRVSNRDALGARLEVVSSSARGPRRSTYAQALGNTGFSASGPREIHFGLGDDDQVDEVRVAWPSGLETTLSDLAVDRRLRIVERVREAHTFDDGEAAGWIPVAGHWQVTQGVYAQSSEAAGLALATDSSYADFSLAAKVTNASGTGRVGILGRVSPDGRQFYAAILAGDEARLYRSDGTGMVPLGDPIPIRPVAPRRSWIVRLDFEGDSIRLTVDRRSTVAVQDSSITAGGIGLATYGAEAAFDNVAVQ